MLIHAQSKIKDAEKVYLRHLYKLHIGELPDGTPKYDDVSSDGEELNQSGDEDESDENDDGKLKHSWADLIFLIILIKLD